MIVYLGALFFALAFTIGGVWSIRRAYGENAATGLQRAQVVILIDDLGEFVEGECTHA